MWDIQKRKSDGLLSGMHLERRTILHILSNGVMTGMETVCMMPTFISVMEKFQTGRFTIDFADELLYRIGGA